MRSTEEELQTKLAESRQRTWKLQVMQMRPGQSPEDMALLKSLERLQRAETLHLRKALESHRTTIEHHKPEFHVVSPRSRIDRKRLLETRLKAKALLASDLPAAARASAKKAVDHADLALGLDDAIARKLARTTPSKAAPTQEAEMPVKALPVAAPEVHHSDTLPERPGMLARIWAQMMGPFFSYNEGLFGPSSLGWEFRQYFYMLGAGIVAMLGCTLVYQIGALAAGFVARAAQ
jgi:hypothetical protein